jgi:uncharacterized protein Usg
MPRNVDHDFGRQMEGWRLTTAEVLYFMPDHPRLLQSFVWQTLDLAPRYPRIAQFLEFWGREIEAVIHSVRIAGSAEIAPAKVRFDREFRLH